MSKRNKNKRTLICLSSEEDGDSSEEEEDDVMSERNKNKRTLICLSSEEDDDDEGEEGGECNFSEDGIDDEEEEEESQSDDSAGDEESLCDRVICLLKEGGDLGALNLNRCKAYLRRHGLRMSGTKTVCIQRIKEHWRIKDGNGEALYPKSSFVINCTGDVCQGDVVLFMQKVYKSFDKVTRHGRFLGKRTVAGRVVSESYGAAKKQHTFTIEVLWSKGVNKLHPLFPLLVKGRNLYKLKTYRQQWNDESERLPVLAEKHKRGTEARFVRAMRQTKKTQSATGDIKRDLCTKFRQHFHHTRLSQKRKTAEPGKGKCFGSGKVNPWQHAKFKDYHQEMPPPPSLNSDRNSSSVSSQFSRGRKNFHQLNDNSGPTFESYTHRQSACPSQIEFHQRKTPFHFSGHDISHPSQIEFHQRNVQFYFSSHDMGHASTMISLPHFKHDFGKSVVPTSQYNRFHHHNYIHHAYSIPNYGLEFRSSSHFPELMTVDRYSHRSPFETKASGRRKNDIRSVYR